jgi:hypothetical protein
MTFRHVVLMLKVLLFLLRSQKAPKSMAEATERDGLETELLHEIEQLKRRNQVL